MALAILFSAVQALAAVTQGYYSSVEGKNGEALFDAISSCAAVGFKSIGYDNLYSAYKQTDNLNGEVWDMYSNCGYDFSNTCGNYSVECDCYNREHSIPQSWWGGGTGNQGNDIFHVLPTDGKVNGMRSNYPYGEVGSATYTSANGSKKGNSIISGYSDIVFEPIDEYKGDIARGILGAMIKWKGTWTQGNGATMFNGDYTQSGNYGLTTYGVTLLMKWHRQDPVSQKEIDRNNGIQATQGNRNPFIDYPYLAEYIWGDKAGETVAFADLVGSFETDFIPGESDGSRTNSTAPTITSPKGTVAFSAVEVGKTATQTITVKGRNLTDAVTLAITGASGNLFTLSGTTVSTTDALAGNDITITYAPTAEGMHTATLTLTSSGATAVEVTLTGNGAVAYKVTYDAGTGTPEVAASNETAVGTGVVLTTATPAASCTDWTFAGWATAPVGETQTEPELLLAGDTYHPTANCTLYAVYKKADENSEAGSGSSDIEFNVKNIAESNSWSNGTQYTSYTIDGITITYSGGDHDGKYYSSGNSWRSYNGGSIVVSGTEISNVVSTPAKTFTKQSDGTWKYKGTATVKFTNFTVTVGAGSTTTFTYTSTLECANCTPAEAAFANSTVEKLTTDGAFTNAFSSDNTSAAEYTSSNTEVATIDANGEVTIVGAGTTTITAIQANDGTHCYVKKQYTLVVTQPAIGDLRVTSTSSDGFCIEWNNIGNTTYTINITSNNESAAETTFLENAFTDEQGDWTIDDKVTASAITTIWSQSSAYGMKASGYYNKNNYKTESWLVSPELDLSLATEATLTFDHTSYQAQENKDYLKLLISEDKISWDEQTIATWPTARWTYVSNTLDLSSYVGKKIYLAFQYKSTATSGLTNDTWEIKNLKVSGKAVESVDGYPKNLTNTTSYCATGLAQSTTYSCKVTTAEGNNTGVIGITTTTTPAATYTITTYSATGGTCSASANTAHQGDVITLDATPDTGYKFARWVVIDGNADDVTVTNNQFTMPASNVEVAASFEEIEYDITFDLTNATAAASNPTTATITDNDITLTFVAANGYELPANVTVTMGSTTLIDNDGYIWNKTKGTLEIIAADGVQGNISITIVATAKNYTITFKNDDETLQSSLVAYGTTPTYAGATPTKAATAQYEYTFSGWSPEIAAVTGEATYTAQFTQKVRSYTVTFVDHDGTTLDKQNVAYGTTPTYAGATPTKAATAQYEYTFSGWSPEIAAVTGEATYTAQFTQKVRSYTVTFVDHDGTTLDKQSVEYGSSAVAPENPTRDGYTFIGWDTDFSSVTSELTVTATYEKNTTTAIGNTTAAEPVCYTTNNTLYVNNLQAGSHLALYDATGRLIAQHRHCNETEHFRLPNGIYIIKIETNGQTTQIKAVK